MRVHNTHYATNKQSKPIGWKVVINPWENPVETCLFLGADGSCSFVFPSKATIFPNADKAKLYMHMYCPVGSFVQEV